MKRALLLAPALLLSGAVIAGPEAKERRHKDQHGNNRPLVCRSDQQKAIRVQCAECVSPEDSGLSEESEQALAQLRIICNGSEALLKHCARATMRMNGYEQEAGSHVSVAVGNPKKQKKERKGESIFLSPEHIGALRAWHILGFPSTNQ